MVDAINPNTPSAASATQAPPVKGFAEISPLGCAFALMMKAFTTMYLSMQKAGIEEANLSLAYNKNGVILTDVKENKMRELREEENKWERLIAITDPTSDAAAHYHHELQAVQAREGALKTTLDALVTSMQTQGSNAADKFSGALKGMNALFDCAKEGLNKVVGTAMQLGNPIANQH